MRNGPESEIQLLFVFKESQAQGLKSDAELQPLPNVFELTWLNPEFLRDPQPMLDRLRQDAPHLIHAHAHFPDEPTATCALAQGPPPGHSARVRRKPGALRIATRLPSAHLCLLTWPRECPHHKNQGRGERYVE